MDSVPETPDQQTRTAVTRRITAHVRRGWPRLGEPIVRHRGRFCYVSALLPGHREPTPILRLRYQGSADRWAIGIYLASSGQYTKSELPASFGPKTGTPEEGVDDTFILHAGPKTGHLRPSARTRAQATKVRNTSESGANPIDRFALVFTGQPALRVLVCLVKMENELCDPAVKGLTYRSQGHR